MIKPQASWVNALLRLIPLAAIERTGARSVGYSTTTLITDMAPSGYLDDLLSRSGLTGVISEEDIHSLVEWINTFSNTEVGVVVHNYKTTAGPNATVYGLTVDHVTLWFIGNAPEADALYQLTEQSAVFVEQKVTASATDSPVVKTLSVSDESNNDEDTPDVGPNTWFDDVSEIPEAQRDWLLTQFEASLERIDRKDLFDALLKEFQLK